MKITAIKQQVKRADRYSIYLDGTYSFSMSADELLPLGLRVNQEVNERELAELKDKALVDKGYDRTLNLIARRPRSEWELRDYLKRKDTAMEVIEAVISKLRVGGYVDDQDFARRWVESRRLLKATSKRRLQQELRQKRVSDEVIQKVLAADDTDEHAILRELVQRKRRQTKYQDDLKLMQYLSRQGFDYDTIKSAMRGED